MLAEIAEVYAKAKRSGLVEVVEKNEHALLLRVKNYTGSRRFGSQKWCISYSIKHWKQYVTKSRKQYFLWTARGI